MSDNLLEYIAEKICSLSMRYTASIPLMPRKYCKASKMVSKDRLLVRYKRGVLIERKRNAFCMRLPKSIFVFEPDIEKKARRMARSDAAFAERLKTLSLNSDDIETIIRELTNGKIRLHLKGRTVYDIGETDV